MPNTSEANRLYEGEGKLLTNYGWVQNTSNLSTVRDTVELVAEDGMNHNALMRAIRKQRIENGMSLNKWTWMHGVVVKLFVQQVWLCWIEEIMDMY